MTWMISDKSTLRGTLYIEILPGPYSNKCWGPKSVFFAEEHFAFIEPTVIRNWPLHDHYSFSDIPSATWLQIQRDLKAMSTIVESGGRLSELANCIYPQRKKRTVEAETTLLSDLRVSINDFNDWLAKTLTEYDTIAILGI
jgi:hypothetical protein